MKYKQQEDYLNTHKPQVCHKYIFNNILLERTNKDPKHYFCRL